MLPAIDLPVRAALPELESALRQHGTAVLVAPPGTGKTTLVPLALADLVPGRVIVAEPRRIAARAAARRMSSLIGEPLGTRVGHSIRGESTVGRETRVEVVTTGVLVRRLQTDPELAGVGAVILDECHERHLDTDLALAFGIDVRASLRPDLVLLAMSATAQSARLSRALGDAPVIEATGGLYDVTALWCPPERPFPAAYGLQVDRGQLDHIAAVVRRAFVEQTGDLLVFLPGTGEIDQLTHRLRYLPIVPLHGRLPSGAQDAALTAGPGRRVVLATSVAESSLTVPGVRVVVDAGMARVPRVDLGRGLGTLVTVPVSRASAHQRAGRAGREGPGFVYRCWSAADHERLPAFPEAEIASADLTGFVLELACWGAPGGRGLELLDPIPAGALAVATATLEELDAVHADGTVTGRGRELTAVGAHPRLARALLDGAPLVGSRRAAEVIAALSEDVPADDLAAYVRTSRDQRWRDEVQRLLRGVPRTDSSDVPGDLAVALVIGLAFPERLARLREAGGRTYLMAGGTAAELPAGSALTGSPWLAIAVADRAPGKSNARIRSAAALDEATALEAGSTLLVAEDEVVWEQGDVRSRAVERLGRIRLREQAITNPDPGQVLAAVREGIRLEGLGLLRWTPAAKDLRRRLAASRAGLGDPWPDVSDEGLLSALDLSTARSRADLQRLDLVLALRGLIPWQVAGLLDSTAPERITVPSGSHVAVDYADPEAPTLPVRVQEVFGWAAAPVVAGRPLRLHLLSPARRVVAVTSDLASFWVQGYPGVRADLRGRYPKHAWPEDPTHAVATSRITPRS